ncbi:MAG: hypothetical protein R2932_44500 [Caldilineaceae bacterium]
MKIVNRRTYIAKRGHLDEMITMLKAEETDLVKRVYRSHYGTFDTAVMEIEFASVAEMEERWAVVQIGLCTRIYPPLAGDYRERRHK